MTENSRRHYFFHRLSAGTKPIRVIVSCSFFLLLFLILFSPPSFLREASSENDANLHIRLVAHASKKSVGIGEEFVYSITVYTGPDVEIEFPKTQDRLGGFEVIDSGIDETSSPGKKIMAKWHRLSGYETGEQTMPALTIRYRLKGGAWRDILSDEATVTVRSVFERTKIEADIRDIEQPISFRWAYKYHIAAGTAILVFISWPALIFIKKRNQRIQGIRRGPHEDALIYDRLNNLVSSLRKDRNMPKEAFVNIAQLTREYLEQRFKLPTREMTTEEFLSSIGAVKGIFEKYGEFLNSFLKTCDLMKFANYNPKDEESSRYVLAVRELLDDINIRPEGEGPG